MRKITPSYYLFSKDRIPRSEFWLCYQLPLLMYACLFFLLLMLNYPDLFSNLGNPAAITAEALAPRNSLLSLIGTIMTILEIPLYVILVMGTIRRWHDRDKSGWWMFIVLLPLVGPLWALIENGFLQGTTGPNRFGPDPLDTVKYTTL